MIMEKTHETAKFRFRPFGDRAREVAPDHRYYYAYDITGPDPTGMVGPVLGIVRKGPDGRWSADSLKATSAPVRGFPTRQRAAQSLVLVEAQSDA